MDVQCRQRNWRLFQVASLFVVGLLRDASFTLNPVLYRFERFRWLYNVIKVDVSTPMYNPDSYALSPYSRLQNPQGIKKVLR